MNEASITRYDKVAIGFHWLIALLIIGNFYLGAVGHELPKDIRPTYMDPHKAIGITILGLSLLRLGWRLGHRPPAFPSDIARWQAMAAKTVHILFYVLTIGIPLSGWVMVSAYPGSPGADFFGLATLDLPVGDSKALSGFAHEGHEIMAQLLLVLFILHVAAALKHQFIGKIALLQRMRF